MMDKLMEKVATRVGCYAFNKPWCSLNEQQQNTSIDCANLIIPIISDEIKKELEETLGLYENNIGFCEISNHVPFDYWRKRGVK